MSTWTAHRPLVSLIDTTPQPVPSNLWSIVEVAAYLNRAPKTISNWRAENNPREPFVEPVTIRKRKPLWDPTHVREWTLGTSAATVDARLGEAG